MNSHEEKKMKSNLLAAGAVAVLSLMVGCASTQEKVTGMDRVTENRKAIATSDKRLEKAQEKLSDFQKDLKDLRADFSTSKYSTGQAASENMERLSLKIEQAQLDLRELRSQNQASARDLDRRLNQAAEENTKVLNQ